MAEADPILTKLGAGPAVKKLVETAITLSNSQDPQQKGHAYDFMKTAIKEMEDHDDDEPIKEEELDNNNNGPREKGSEQSSDNEEPYPQVADTEPHEEGMNDAAGENQFNETGGMPNGQGMIVPGLPPQQGPGLAPDIAQEMGNGMGQPMPQMNTPQMMRQMQYTINAYHKQHVEPQLRQYKEVIRRLSKEVQETKKYNGAMKLDLRGIKENAPARFREMESPQNIQSNVAVPLLRHKGATLENARNEISQMDKELRASKNDIYQ